MSDLPEFEVGHVLEAKTGGYLVKSRTCEGAWWLVAGRDCSCPAGQHGTTVCWHRTQVARFVKALNEKHRRPRADDTSEATVARFVD